MIKRLKYLSIVLVTVLTINFVVPIALVSKSDDPLDELNFDIKAAKRDSSIDNVKNAKALKGATSSSFDYSKLSKHDKAKFVKIVNEEVSISGLKNKRDKVALKQALFGLFNSKSANFNNVKASQSLFVKKAHSSAKSLSKIMAMNVKAKSKHGLISVSFAGHAINLALAFASGVGVTAVRKALLKMGKSTAKHFVKRVLISKLKKWGMKAAGRLVTLASDAVFEFLSPGLAVAKFIDKHDKKKKNGYLELW